MSDIALELAPVEPKPVTVLLADYWILTKPEINFLVLIAAFAGFYLGSSAAIDLPLLLHTLMGTLLVSSGAGALNQYLEREFDRRMKRTARRPIPSGRVTPSAALGFGIVLAGSGVAWLALAVNGLAALLALATLSGYLVLYTPLKRKSAFCTLVGAVPGAMPPLIGWAAAAGSLTGTAWLLYFLLFLWQFPHFMAIAWMYREDYARGGYRVFPSPGTAGRLMFWQTLIPSAALVALTLSHAAVGALSLLFFCCAIPLAFHRSNAAARRLLMASILYLPLAFLLMVLGKPGH